MDPELVALVLILASGSVTWLARRRSDRTMDHGVSGSELERHASRALLRPLVPIACAAVFLAGWALFEPPVADEIPPRTASILAVLYGVVVLRAISRVVPSVGGSRELPPAAVIGLFRPKVVVDPSFLARLDPAARHAVVAHEEAHARAYDPLRLVAFQLAADLQWPLVSATEAHSRWCAALEIARDEEARRRGADGAALAAGILEASRHTGRRSGAVASAASESGDRLRARIARLLEPIPRLSIAPSARSAWIVAGAGALAVLGATVGDVVLGVLCRVLP